MSEITEKTERTEHSSIAAGMVVLLWAGARLDTLSDLQDMLDAIGVMGPDVQQARVAIAWWHVRERAWSEALRELRRIESEGALASLGTALTAVCLYALGAPMWRTYAYAAAYQSDDPMATRTALALLSAPDVGQRGSWTCPTPYADE
ncbi:MAG: type secretion protein HrpB1 [Paraburkholderia sp.]|nr:type secretion protein HrpB1 [Paraburkholderia sp.]